MTNHEYMTATEKKVAQCWAKLMQHFNRVLPSPRIRFDLRSRRTAGQASSLGFIRFNLAFVTQNAVEMLEQTVPHEVSHAWLYAIRHPSHCRSSYGSYQQFSTGRRSRRNPHGPEFMEIMHLLGARQERTHNMKVDVAALGRRGVTWKYKCDKCGHIYNLSTQLHNKIMRGQHRWHPPCGPNSKVVRAY